ncbi:hypothetical protein HYH02_006352 [Chlamydomonas schloesseri]|uniref:Uncharacterized protein n=1 Tax=Chlamydomonas schloesseri TaxID=2026947 RepID=A0A836B5W8_9CHLO|nr:hypothetical protein HYH02_006352 [Chlamydomonas schloesseri]|eukprot:KAG2448460.1 hypothetical protein HYH02_006352 [Chlamydomonas schloesseri]
MRATLAQRGTLGAKRTAFGAAPVRPASVVRSSRASVRAQAGSSDSADVGTAGLAAIALGLPANAIMLWSEYTLKTTGAGLPPGPGGALGAAEGISYLVVLAVIGWSIYTKVSTGTGLPAGPSGLLGAVEGISYLSLLVGIVVFALKYLS